MFDHLVVHGYCFAEERKDDYVRDALHAMSAQIRRNVKQAAGLILAC